MPLVTLPPVQALAAVYAARQSAPRAQAQLPDGITVEAPVVAYSRDAQGRQVIDYPEGAVATYGPTVIRTDHLTLHVEGDRKWGEAFGHVTLTDPEGTMTATRMVFDWTSRTGTGENVVLDVGGMNLKAEHIEVLADRWELTNVEATSCGREKPPLYLIRTPRLTIRPGRQAVAQRPRLSIFGQQVVTLPTQRLSLDRRDPGLRFPSIGYKAGQGFGIGWFSGFLLNEQTSVTGSFSAFPRSYPSFNAQLARSFVPAERSNAPIPPRSELTERFSWSYLDDIHVPQPLSEENFLRSEKHAVALTTTWNTGASARDVDARYSKPLEVSYERGGKIGGFGMLSQARVHFIRQGDEAVHTRGIFQTALSAPNVALGKNLYTRVRFDASAFLGGTAFGWGRAQFGLQYQPATQLTLGVGYIASVSAGDPLFPIDELFSKHAFHARADLNLGPTKISYLVKYDLDRKLIYDREYEIRQVVGCIEPFVLYRQFPSEYAFGFRLRADDFFSAIERRRVQRTKPADPEKQTIISGPMNHGHGG